jgi:DNA polymerase-3 subunit delta
LVYEEFLDEFEREINPIDKRDMKKIEENCKVLPAKKKNEKKAMLFYVSRELEIEEYKAEKICEMIGDDFLKVKQEVAKLQNYFDGEDFSLEEAEKIISVNEEYSLRKSIELFLEKGECETLLKCLAEKKEYLLFLYSIYDELTLLLKIKALEKRGIIDKRTTYNHFKGAIYDGVKEFFRRENGRYISEYPIFLKFKLMEKFDLEFLKKRMEEVVETEFEIKSGQVSDEIGIEKFILGFYREEKE